MIPIASICNNIADVLRFVEQMVIVIIVAGRRGTCVNSEGGHYTNVIKPCLRVLDSGGQDETITFRTWDQQ